jgi:hypothetical protein
MTYSEQPGNQGGGSWSGQPGWDNQPPPTAPASPYGTPEYSSGTYPSAAAAPTPAAPPRPGALTAGAALSFVTAVSAAVVGTAALITVVATSAVRSALGSYSSYGSSAASNASSGAALVVIIALGLAFLLFWGGLDAALARGVTAAMAGNIVAIVPVVIAATQSSGFVLLLAIVPVLAVITLVSGRAALSPRPAA